MTEREKTINKIFHLLQKTPENGCTEDEALLAAKKAGELMDQFHINITDVEIRESECITYEYVIDGKNRTKIDTVFVSISAFCDVKCWFEKQSDKSKYVFFGLQQDIAMAEYLIKLIFDTYVRSINEFKNDEYYLSLSGGKKRSAYASFSRAFASRINYRLSKMKQERENHMNKEQERTGKNVVLVKKNMIEDEFQKQHDVKLQKNYNRRVNNDSLASMKGSKAGDRVNLSNPINNHMKQKQLSYQ